MLEFIRSSYFKDLLASFSVGVVIFNEEGTVYAINDASISILGINGKQHEGSHWKDIFKGIVDIDSLEKAINFAKDHQVRSGSVTTSLSGSKNKTLHLSLTASALIYFKKIWGIMVEISDVTDIYLLHEREKQILKEKSIVQIERTEALRKLSMAVAHQIRNPATAIGGLARLLLKKPGINSEASSYLNAILESSKRLEEIVHAAFEYSRIQVGKKEPAPLKLIVYSAMERIRDENILWDIDLPEMSVPVDFAFFTDALYEIFKNSVESVSTNAIKIVVSARNLASNCVIEISDNGSGISEKDMPFIFDPYFSTKPQGMGIGLCKAERIVKEHMGSMEIESKEGKGTKAKLIVPLKGNEES